MQRPVKMFLAQNEFLSPTEKSTAAVFCVSTERTHQGVNIKTDALVPAKQHFVGLKKVVVVKNHKHKGIDLST